MLKHITSIYEYRDYLDSEKENLSVSDLKRLSSISFKKAIFKLRKLDVELASSLLSSLYSSTGRPAIDPAILIRSFMSINPKNGKSSLRIELLPKELITMS